MKPINFSQHAQEKLGIVQSQGFIVNEEMVIAAVRNTDEVIPGYLGRFIAQTPLNDEHLLRVVYEEGDAITIVTMYPGRRERYEA